MRRFARRILVRYAERIEPARAAWKGYRDFLDDVWILASSVAFLTGIALYDPRAALIAGGAGGVLVYVIRHRRAPR